MKQFSFTILFVLFLITLCSFISTNPLLEMIKIEGGAFMMGSSQENFIADKDEQKKHLVNVNSFEINRLEVTVWEWKDYCKKTKKAMPAMPSWGWNDNYPITNITWFEAVDYCNWLSKKDGLTPVYKVAGSQVFCDFDANGYRLPTEAEWEYAAKGGKKSKNYHFSGANSIHDIAWFMNNSDKKPHHVGTKLPNELGLYDMSGNVWEWCWDWYSKDYYKVEDKNNPKGPIRGEKKSVRGGSSDCPENYLRTANRICTLPDKTKEYYGFRLARTIH